MGPDETQRPSPPLVSTEWLQEHLDDSAVTIVEISSDLADQAAYDQDHIPGSLFAHWKDLLWHETDRQFPSPSIMSDRLTRLGVPRDGTIALVGDPVQYSTYAFWVLTMAGQGHRVVHVDGGRSKWLSEERPLTPEVPKPGHDVVEVGEPDPSSRIGRDEVLEGISDAKRLILDVRSPEEYAGERVSPSYFEVDHGAQRKGHIPGARHLYYDDLLTDQGAYLSPEELRSHIGDLPIDTSEVVVYCRLSHRATLVWFALKFLLGAQDVRIYDGSWTEWGSIVGFPIER